MFFAAWFSVADRVGTVAIEAITIAYFFALGATVGSFINVVVYRLPNGIGLLRPASFCPACRARIMARDNLPVLGWLLRRGRCRACGARISPRYPLVELVMGLLFLALAYAELLSGGANLPVRPPNGRSGPLWTLFFPAWDLLGLYVYHAALLSALATLVLLKIDRRATPLSVAIFSTAVGLVAPIIWLQLHPAAFAAVPLDAGNAAWIGRIGDAMIDVAVGWLLGSLFALGNPPGARGQRTFEGTTLALVLSGVYLGWPAAVSVALLAGAARLIVAALSFRSFSASRLAALPPVAFPAVATLVQIVAWRRLSEIPHWPKPPGDALDITAAIAAIAAASLAARWLAEKQTPTLGGTP